MKFITDNKYRKIKCYIHSVTYFSLELCIPFQFIQISALQVASKTQKKVCLCVLFYFHHANGGFRIKRKKGRDCLLCCSCFAHTNNSIGVSVSSSLQRKYTYLLHINSILTLLKFSVLI